MSEDNDNNLPPPHPHPSPPRSGAPPSGRVPHMTTESIPHLSSAPSSGNTYNYYDWTDQQDQQMQQYNQEAIQAQQQYHPHQHQPPVSHQQQQQQQQYTHTQVQMPPPRQQQQQGQQHPPPPPPPPPQQPPPPNNYQLPLPPPPTMSAASRSAASSPVPTSSTGPSNDAAATFAAAPPPFQPQPTTTQLPPPPVMTGAAKAQTPTSTSAAPIPTPTAATPTRTGSNVSAASSSNASSSAANPNNYYSSSGYKSDSSSNFSTTTSNTATTNTTTNTANANAPPTSPTMTTWVPPKEEPPAIPLTAHLPSSIRYLAHRQCHVPILVIGTESAHKIAWKNQLRLVDMLQGIARTLPDYATRAIPPFRSITNKSLSLSWKDVPLDFVTPDQLARPMSYEISQSLLQDQAQLQASDGNLAQELNLLEDQVDSLLQETSTPESHDYMADFEARTLHEEQVVKDAFSLTSPLNIPWLLRYRYGVDASTDQLPHDLMACPPVCLLICTTQESHPLVDTLRELGSRHYLPPAYSNGLYDPKLLRQEALVLHDTVQGPRDWDEAGLRSNLQRHFGPSASILRLNGILPQTALQLSREETTDEWGGGGQCGNCLSHSDRLALRQYLESLTTSSVLPSLERRLSDLNVIVSDRKKGVKNVLKSFWRKPKEANPEDTINRTKGEIAYRHDTIESQTRLLADTLFLVKDYDAALGMYRLIRDDYKHDKAMMHYASVQEMMALCMYFLDPYSRARDIVSHIETALLAYSKAAEDERPTPDGQNRNARPVTASHATRCATRLCLWLSSCSDTILSGRHLEVADLLASASSHETSLGAAVLLEQSSAQYHYAGMYRKYAFHMLMSGHMFRTANQEAHAFRCFTSALYLYRDRPWNELHNHLRSALAAQLYSMGRMSVSVQLYAKLVGIPSGGSVSVKSQQKFVNNLLFICNEHPKKALVGADRMAAPAELSNADRDKYRQERLDRIVQVIQYTNGAQRVLELPRVRLPNIVDASIVVETPEAWTGSSTDNGPSLLGTLDKGSDAAWEELKIMTTAELRAAEATKVQKLDDDVTTKALARIEDYDIRRVIAQVDKAKQNRNLIERNKRSSSYKGDPPPIRARGEPMRVVFTLNNPLSIPVDMADIQLVAHMTSKEGRLFTNQEAIRITPSKPEPKKWNFQSSNLEFETPEFSRLSPESGSENKSWTAGYDLDDPYFVVSKQSLSLEAQGQTSIALGICPLVEGNLEVVGVRSRLLDDVWVYHPFKVEGKLLHNTRSNRAKGVRAEPILLKASIKQGMPCLTSQLIPQGGESGQEDAQDHLLHGQTGTWTLRLTNIGTAAATAISLKANLPWIHIPSIDDSALDTENVAGSKLLLLENQAKSCCVGPTGTLFELPIKGSHLKQEGSIQPGESVDLSIQIKTGVGGGTKDFYMLYRYELDDPTAPPSNNTPHRWLKRMYKVPVYPSLSFTASVLPSTWNKAEYILSVELTNHRNDRPSDIKILLEKLILVSRSYRLEQLPGQISCSDGAGVEVDWRERLTVHYRLISLEKAGNVCLLSECPFLEETTNLVEVAQSPAADYLCLEKACAKFEGTWKRHQIDLLRAQSAKDREEAHPQSISQIRKANTSTKRQESGISGDGPFDDVDIGAAHATSIAKLFPADRSLTKINLICSWSAELGGGSSNNGNARIHGEHHLCSVPVRPATKTLECPITISADYPSAVSHDFGVGPAVVPFKVTLRNQFVARSVKFIYEVEKQKYFDIVGALRLEWTLEAGKELVVPQQAIIPGPGVHNLQSIIITLDEEFQLEGDDEPAAFNFGVQWIVNISPK